MSKSCVLSALVLACAAGAAQAQFIGVPTPIGEGEITPRVPAIVYSAIPGPYQAFAAAPGALGFDDYVSTDAGPSMLLARFRFVGGVAAAGGTVRVAFFNADQSPATSFTVTLPQAGNFVWNINLGTLPDGSDSTLSVPAAGLVQIDAINGATGQWFLTPTLPTVGTSSLAIGGAGGTLNHAMELIAVPAPAAAALFGMGGLVALRRRR